jgi:hypothetical protein
MSNTVKNMKSRKIESEEYVDMALKNILNYNASVAEKENLDLEKVKSMQIYLVNQAETVLLGCGFINKKKKRFNADEITVEEQAVFDALKVYYNSKPDIFGINVERFAMRLMEQLVDGEYDSKVNYAREKLKEQVANKELSASSFELQLANYKLQLMLDAVKNDTKVVNFEF